MFTLRARPFPLARYCIGLAVLAALLGGPWLFGVAAQSSGDVDPVSYLNRGRTAGDVQPLDRHDGLDRLAQRYLDDILASRDLVPPGYGQLNQRVLTEDVVAAIGEDGQSYRYTGVVVSYGVSLPNALQIALGTEANGPALLEPALDFAGVASATIPPPPVSGELWLAPPPGGVGLDIELTGMTIVVIVTAGDFRAST